MEKVAYTLGYSKLQKKIVLDIVRHKCQIYEVSQRKRSISAMQMDLSTILEHHYYIAVIIDADESDQTSIHY
jgi:hypothetical protein